MDNTALADLLTTANKMTPPKPEVLARLGKLIADEPAFFNVRAGLTRFDVDRKGKPTGWDRRDQRCFGNRHMPPP